MMGLKTKKIQEFTMIGCSGAGKTTLVAGLFSAVADNFVSRPDNISTEKYVHDVWGKLLDNSWPNPTLKGPIKLAFNITRNHKDHKIQFTDYPGSDVDKDSFERTIVKTPTGAWPDGALLLFNCGAEYLKTPQKVAEIQATFIKIIETLAMNRIPIALVVTAWDMMKSDNDKNVLDEFLEPITALMKQKKCEWARFNVSVADKRDVEKPFCWLLDQQRKPMWPIIRTVAAVLLLAGALLVQWNVIYSVLEVHRNNKVQTEKNERDRKELDNKDRVLTIAEEKVEDKERKIWKAEEIERRENAVKKREKDLRPKEKKLEKESNRLMAEEKRLKAEEEKNRRYAAEIAKKEEMLQKDNAKLKIGQAAVKSDAEINRRDKKENKLNKKIIDKERETLNHERANIKRERDEINKEKSELQKNITTWQTERDKLRGDNKELQTKNAQLKSERDALQSNNKDLQGQNKRLESERDELRSKNKALEVQKAKQQNEYDELQGKTNGLQTKNAQLQRECDELKRKLKAEQETNKLLIDQIGR